MQDTTGIVYATSFPALDAAIAEVSKYFASQTRLQSQLEIPSLLNNLRSKLESTSGPMSSDCLSALQSLEVVLSEAEKIRGSSSGQSEEGKLGKYEFDRKFLFKMLVLGNAQLAQIIKARGPNMQTNAACAGATQAVICLSFLKIETSS